MSEIEAIICREPQLFNANKGSTTDEVCEAIMRTFKTLDKEILEDAHCSKIKDCQYGGTTALLALCIGQVTFPLQCLTDLPLLWNCSMFKLPVSLQRPQHCASCVLVYIFR